MSSIGLRRGGQGISDTEINKDIEVELELLPRHVDPNFRKVCITKALVEKFGGTDECFCCTTPLLEGTGVAHHERSEKLMRKDPSEKGKCVYRDQEKAGVRQEARAEANERGAQGGLHEPWREWSRRASQEACEAR